MASKFEVIFTLTWPQLLELGAKLGDAYHPKVRVLGDDEDEQREPEGPTPKPPKPPKPPQEPKPKRPARERGVGGVVFRTLQRGLVDQVFQCDDFIDPLKRANFSPHSSTAALSRLVAEGDVVRVGRNQFKLADKWKEAKTGDLLQSSPVAVAGAAGVHKPQPFQPPRILS